MWLSKKQKFYFTKFENLKKNYLQRILNIYIMLKYYHDFSDYFPSKIY